MAQINKPTKTYKTKNSDRAKERQSLYQTKSWKSLSKWFRMNNPICMQCNKQAAVHVHHILSPFAKGLTEEEKYDRLLDLDNLLSVCQECHNELHGQGEKQKRLEKYKSFPHINNETK